MDQVDDLVLGNVQASWVRCARHAYCNPQVDRLRFVPAFEGIVDQIAGSSWTALVIEKEQVPAADSVLAVTGMAGVTHMQVFAPFIQPRVGRPNLPCHARDGGFR